MICVYGQKFSSNNGTFLNCHFFPTPVASSGKGRPDSLHSFPHSLLRCRRQFHLALSNMPKLSAPDTYIFIAFAGSFRWNLNFFVLSYMLYVRYVARVTRAVEGATTLPVIHLLLCTSITTMLVDDHCVGSIEV